MFLEKDSVFPRHGSASAREIPSFIESKLMVWKGVSSHNLMVGISRASTEDCPAKPSTGNDRDLPGRSSSEASPFPGFSEGSVPRYTLFS